MNSICKSVRASLLLAGGLLCSAPLAAALARVSVVPSMCEPGGRAVAWVTLENAVGTTGADVSLRLPDFALPGPVETDDLAEGFLVASSARPGRVDLAFASATGLSADQPVAFRIPFTIGRTAEPGAHPLAVERLRLYDSSPRLMLSEAVVGTLIVTPPPVDVDGDGLPDEWERTYFGHTGGTGEADTDGDGIIDSAEFIAGTDPTRAESVLAIEHMTVNLATGTVELRWQSREDRSYAIDWSDDPLGPDMVWQSVYRPLIRPNPEGAQWTDDGSLTYELPQATSRRFYRIRTVVP